MLLAKSYNLFIYYLFLILFTWWVLCIKQVVLSCMRLDVIVINVKSKINDSPKYTFNISQHRKSIIVGFTNDFTLLFNLILLEEKRVFLPILYLI